MTHFFRCCQGYERVRHDSDEELFLLRADDVEEGSSHSDLSSSGDHQSENVSAAKAAEQTDTARCPWLHLVSLTV